MEQTYLQGLMDWISAHPHWAGLAIFLIAFVESLVMVGFLLPGIFILFGVGAMIGMGVTGWGPIWLGGSLGAFCGDLVSFAVGQHYRLQLRRMWPFSRYPAMLQRGVDFFRKHGAKSVLAGRFIGPLRPVIPTTAGMLGMPLRRFLAVCIPACVLWTPVYLVPGILFGASLDVASEYAGRLALVLALAVAIVWLSLWFIRLVYEVFVVHSARFMRHAIRWSRRHPVLGRVLGPVVDPAQPEALSVSMLGLLLVGALCGLLLLLLLAPFGAEPGRGDLAVLAWTQTLRNDMADILMVAVSQLSRWWVLLPTMMATLLWLLGADRKTAAIHWLVAMIGGFLLQSIMSWTLRSVPLMQMAAQEQTFLPSVPMTMATVVLGFFAVLVARELKRKHRKWPYLASTLLLTALLIARVYLGLDWLSGALVGFILGLAWTAIVGMAYRARALRPFSGPMASAIFFGTLTLTMMWQIDVHQADDLHAVRLAVQPVPMNEALWWQEGWSTLPRQRTRATAPDVRDFNLQLALTPQLLSDTLAAEGWESVGPAGWRWILQSLNPQADVQNLPLTGRNYLGQREALVLRQVASDEQRQRVLRIWDSGVRLNGQQPLYLGQLYDEVLVRRLRFFSAWRQAPLSPQALSEFVRGLPASESRQAGTVLLIRRPRPENGATLPAAPVASSAGP